MIQSVERAVQILRCFGDRELLGVTEIASMTQLNKSTAFGLVTTLTETGLLEQDELTGRYRLGLELFRLGSRVNADTRRLVAPALSALTEQLEETVNFVRPEGSNVVYLVKRESLQSMRICTKMGQRLPMYCTAVGKGEESKARTILQQLYLHYLGHPEELPPDFQTQLDFEGMPRIVCDYIAGMTDKYAIYKYNEIFIPAGWQIR